MSTLLILPGWGGNKDTWKEFITYLQKKQLDGKVEPKVLELPCFGDEPCPDEVWGVEEYAEFVNRKIKQDFNTETIFLLGHSFGGAVATRLCYKYPDTVNKLILTAPALKRPNNKLKKALFYLPSKIGKILFNLPIIGRFKNIAKKLLYKFAGTHDYRKTSGIKSKIFKKVVKEDQMDVISEIKEKTLVIWGDEDELLSAENSLEIIRNLSDAWLRIIKSGGHGLHQDHKKELRGSINKFIG